MVHAESTGADEAERSPEQFEFGKWYPIATAPKDGSEFLTPYPIWKPDNATPTPSLYQTIIVHWNGRGWDRGGWMLHEEVTHWMPLPIFSGDRSIDSESDAGSLNQITSSESNSDA